MSYQIYLNIVSFTAETTNVVTQITANTGNVGVQTKFGILGNDGIVRDYHNSDFYINIGLFRTDTLEEYVDIKKQENIESLERQEFNPFYIEIDFFNTITRNRIIHGNQLNETQIGFIRLKRPDIDTQYPTDGEVKVWFENFGYKELPWNKGTINEVTINDIDITGKTNTSIISKANVYNIDINK